MIKILAETIQGGDREEKEQELGQPKVPRLYSSRSHTRVPLLGGGMLDGDTEKYTKTSNPRRRNASQIPQPPSVTNVNVYVSRRI